MIKFLKFSLLLLVLVILSCENNVKRPTPTKIIYQETIKEDNKVKINRTCYYSIYSVSYDTIQKNSSIEIVSNSYAYKNLPEDRVDLNDVFGKYDDETDWNFTELEEKDWEYLKKMGIYWDEETGCFRKKKSSIKQAVKQPR